LLAASGALLLLTGAADPEIIKVWVPAKDVSKWFPPVTELRILSPEEFESRVGAALEMQAARRSIRSPRLIRARHHARWSEGLLSGRTDLVLAANAAGPSEYILEPWTPAILAAPQTPKTLGARDSGKVTLWLEPSPRQQTIGLDWELRARPHSHGRGFTVGLPGDEMAVLELDLPKGWIASSQRGIRRGPLPAGDPARSLWEIDAESGRFSVEVRDPWEPGKPKPSPSAWLSTTTEVDLRRRPSLGGEVVNWTSDWRVEHDPRNPGRLQVELDSGLELIDIQGPELRGYRLERSGSATRVSVALQVGTQSTAVLRFLAHAQVPSEGPWTIPAMRPLDAIWTSGTTTVILDELHVVRECREKAGRLIVPGRGNPGPVDRLVFEAEASGSVAQLVFHKPQTELSCTVRGQLDLGEPQPRVECRLDWVLHRGFTPELEIDLSPGWHPDAVQILGLDDQVTWHPSVLPTGVTRLSVLIPSTMLARKEWTLTIGASSTAPAGRGPLELPRVRALGAAIADEAWLAWVDDGTIIQPSRARGISWIDPVEVPGLFPRNPRPNLREALAWRWTAEAAEARIERERIAQVPRASISARVRVGPGGRELSLDGTIRVSSGTSPLDTIPLWINQPGAALESWRFRDRDGIALALRPLEDPVRSRLGFPREGTGGSLVVALPGLTEKAIHFQVRLPWKSPGSVPLLAVPPEYFQVGTILVDTPAGMRSRTQTSGLDRLNPTVAGPLRAGLDPDGDPASQADRSPPGYRVVHAFSYTEPGAQLELVTEPLVPSPMPGVVHGAVLTTSVDVRGRLLNRLRLLVQFDQNRSLDLVMPPRSALIRVRRDGSEVAPIPSGSHLCLPASGSGQGVRSATILLDYATQRAGLSDGAVLRPELPLINLPCLSFVWEIVSPPAWEAIEGGPGLIANDRNDPADWPSGSLGLWKPVWSFLPGRAAPGDADRLRLLDDRLLQPPAEELTFAEWFSRWDSGTWPVVIDRLALKSAGLEPRSACVPSRVKTDRRSISLATLQQHGLALVPFPDVFLITTEAEASRFAQQGRWASAIDETLAWGSDRTDRLQTVSRWRGEAFPRTAVASGDEAGERMKSLPGRCTWRFSGSSWPQRDSFVQLIDVPRRILMAWILIALLVTAWVAVRRRLSRGRILLPGLLAAVCVMLDELVPARYAGATAAGFTGALVVLIQELSRMAWKAPAPTRRVDGSQSSRLRRATRAAVGAALVLPLLGAITSLRAAQPEGGPSILALFPYEGSFDPTRRADRVILRLDDFRRLCQLSGNPTPPPVSTVQAVSAAHRVARVDAQNIIVESQFELMARGRSPFSWEIPVAFARDIEVTLDGKPQPIAIEPEGITARVELVQAGNHVLRIRRSAAARTDEAGFETLSLPVNAVPTANLTVEPPRDGAPQGELVAQGRSDLQHDQRLHGRLGPTDRIVVRWPRLGSQAAHQPAGSVDALVLWDVTPGGDRLRARLTVHQPQELSRIRLAHDPGLVLRSAYAPGPIDVVCEDDPGKGQWILSIDPPLPAGSTLAIDCWRPSDAEPADTSQPRGRSGRPGTRVRRLPQVEPVGVERFSGWLAVRRPGDWTGRLEPLKGTDPLNDESFVRAWGVLPEEPLTLAGSSRFVRALHATLQTGPTPSRIQVRPTVQLQIESGRIVLVVDAELSARSGRLPIIEAELPAGIQITQVTGEGLTDWMISADHRLHLIWDRQGAVSSRHVRISGWIPVTDDPMKVGPRQYRIPVPWIGWAGVELNAGSLAVSSNARAEILGAAGLTLLSSESSGSGGPSAWRNRLTYRVADPGRLGEIRWESTPPRLSVTIESQMTLHPDFAQWVAVLRYDVTGGALDAIHLKMPSEWASKAKLDLGRAGDQLTTEVRGPSAYWSITPKRPIWGSRRFVLRSTLPLSADREIVHPEVAPLGGRGGVDAYLGVVNATGQPLTAEGSTGLQPIPYADRFQAQEFARGVGSPDRAFRVSSQSWVLRVQLPRTTSEDSSSANEAARVAFADLSLSVASDRSIIGRGLYETPPGSGRLWTIELPAGSSILWATVNSNPAVPLRLATGAWSLVLDGHGEDRIGLIWRSPGVSSAATQPGGWWIALPKAGAGPSRALLTVSTPPEVTTELMTGGLEPTTMARLEMARADAISRAIRDFLPKLDRSSGRDHERLVSMLINHDQSLRAAERRVRFRESTRTGNDGGRSDRDSAMISMARKTLAEAIESAGLGADLTAARSYLGQAPSRLSRPPVAIPEPGSVGRIRAFGRPTAFSGMMMGIDQPASRSSLILATRPRWLSPDEWPARSTIIIPLLLGAAIAASFLRGSRLTGVAALATVLGVAGYAGGPMMLAGALGLAAMAWKQGSGRQ
jgi:hypothetical protein